MIFALLFTTVASGQTKWAVTPYAVQIWTTIDPACQLPEAFANDLNTQLQQQAVAYLGAAWRTKVASGPQEFSAFSQNENWAAEFEQLKAALGDPLPDKLLVVAVSSRDAGFLIRAREFDVASQLWGPPIEVEVAQAELIPRAAMLALAEAFAPLVHLGSVEGKQISGRLRAAELIVQNDSPALVRAGDVMLPVIRRGERFGRSKASIEVVPWTVLRVASRDESVVTSEIQSANRRGLTGRESLRVQRLALAWPVTDRTTQLSLQTATSPSEPLANYEVVESADGKTANLSLGVTDWQGTLEIGRGKNPLRVVYVKSGTNLLARLPLVPSWQAALVANLADDEPRVLADSMLTKLKQEVVDTVARRELLSSRIRTRIISGRFEDAEGLMREYRKLGTRRDFARRIEAARQDFTSSNPRVQAQVDKLFQETAAAVGKLLDPDAADKLEQQIARARTVK